MKVTVTHLKAPWPEGTKLGDVVEVGDELPGCFVGKCKPAEDKAKAAHTYKPAPPVQPQAEPGVAVVAAAGNAAEELAIAQRMLAEAKTATDQLTDDLVKTRAERDKAVNDLAVVKAERDRLAAEAGATKPKK